MQTPLDDSLILLPVITPSSLDTAVFPSQLIDAIQGLTTDQQHFGGRLLMNRCNFEGTQVHGPRFANRKYNGTHDDHVQPGDWTRTV